MQNNLYNTDYHDLQFIAHVHLAHTSLFVKYMCNSQRAFNISLVVEFRRIESLVEYFVMIIGVEVTCKL